MTEGSYIHHILDAVAAAEVARKKQRNPIAVALIALESGLRLPRVESMVLQPPERLNCFNIE